MHKSQAEKAEKAKNNEVICEYLKKHDQGSDTVLVMLNKDITKSWDTWNWVLTFLVFHSSRIAFTGLILHENIVQRCGKLFHMLAIWFFYRHFGMESAPDSYMY